MTASALARLLLRPRSVALVGASGDPDKTAGRPLRYLREAGFAGTVYPVNPRRARIQGEDAWPGLAALPEVPEHVFVLTPTETVLETVRECARLGVGVVTVLAAGFSEAGAEGAAREAELRAALAGSRTRLLGPSSLGVICPATGLALTANAAFAEPMLAGGRLFVASHSGSMLGALASRGKAHGMGFAGLVSVGNETDTSLGEICAATLDDPAIDGYLLFLESLRHGDWLRRFALAARARGRPVLAYKLGRSPAAAEMAQTHTGALAGEDDVADAFLKDLGIIRLGVLDALFEAFPLARRIGHDARAHTPPRIGVVTTTGGGAAMAVDQLGVRGVEVVPASTTTLARLAAAGIATQPGRVVDLTLAGTRYAVMKGALDILLAAPEFDLVLAVVGSSARFQPQLAVQPIIDCAGSGRPLAAMLVPDAPQALAALAAAGVPCFGAPESCADAIAAVFAARVPGAQPAATLPAAAAAQLLDEAQGHAVFDAIGLPRVPGVLLAPDAPPATLPFAAPVVAKLCSAQIAHKTEIGGVILGPRTADELAAAFATLRGRLAAHAPAATDARILVQPQRTGLAEVLVGYRIDPQAGPIVMLAAGGIWAEVARDRSIRLAPVDRAGAEAMIREVRALQVVAGRRGRPRGDLAALADALVAISRLALRPELGVIEAEANPVLVLPEGEGVLALDALVRQAQP